jgi:TatA/E family protein of Tat protein translocase
MVAIFDSPESWLWVVLIGAAVFGSGRLPELARSIGRSRSEFRKGLQEGEVEPTSPGGDPPTDAPS